MVTTFRYAFYCLIAVVATFVIHEFSHWVMGEVLGYEMVMTLNTGYPAKGSYDTPKHYTLISAVGPLTTLAEAILMFFLIRKYSNLKLYPFLFTCFYLDLLSGALNLSTPNDLGRISLVFSLPLLTLPILFVTIQSILVYKTSKRENYNMRFNMITFFWIVLFSSLWIISNKLFSVTLL